MLDYSGATIIDNSSLTLSGPSAALTLSAGAFDLNPGGSIVGGVISDPGSSMRFGGGTLAGVTYQGTLDLSGNYSLLTIADGLAAEGVGGVGPGAINVSGYESSVTFDDTQTIDNATITLGGYDDTISDYATYAAYVAAGYTYTTQTLTLGAGLVINQTGYGDFLGNNQGYGYANLVNDGTINAEGTYSYYYGGFTIDPNSFTNNGAINVSNGETLNISAATNANNGTIDVSYGSLDMSGANVTNAAGGTITVAAGSSLVFGDGNGTDTASNAGTITADSATVTLYLNETGWNTGTLAITNSTVNLYGNLTTADLAPFEDQGDTVNLYGTLDNTASTLVVGTGSPLGQLTLESGATITGGVIQDAGSGMAFDGGTLDGVTYQGTLDLTASSSSVTITDGLIAEGVGGVGPGAINVSGYESSVTFDDTQTIDNATITLGGYDDTISDYATYAAYVAAGYTYTTQTLTLGAGLVINQTGYGDFLGNNQGYGYANLVNDGTINAEGTYSYYYGGFTIDPNSFTNNGAINVSNGETLNISAATNANNGTIDVSNGSLDMSGANVTNAAGATITVAAGSSLVFGNGYGTDTASNAGTITADSATVTFYLNETGWNTGTLAISNSTVNLYGNLTTADLAPFEDQGDTVNLYGTLDNTASTLVVGTGSPLGQLTLESGATITGGVIQDAGSGMAFDGGTLDGVTYQGTLDLTASSSSVTITDGLIAEGVGGVGPGAINVSGYESSVTFDDTQTIDNATITLGGYDDTISDYATYAAYVAAGYTYTTQTLTLGAGLVINQTGYGDFLGNNQGYGYANLVNDGTINAEGTYSYYYGGFTIDPNSFTNNGAINVSNGETLNISAGTFTNLSGTTLTGGVYSVVGGGVLNLPTNNTVTVLDADLTLGAGSTVQSYDNSSGVYVTIDQTLTEIGSAGVLRLAGGRVFTLSNAVTIDAGGKLYGAGSIAGALTDNGEIEASGGVLDITGAVSGSAAAVIDASAGLELGAADAGTITFGGNNTLTLDSPSSFSGTLVGFAAGDTLDLKGISATSAVANTAGDQLIVTTASGQLTYHLSGGGDAGQTFLVTNTTSSALITIGASQAPVLNAPAEAVVQQGQPTAIGGVSIVEPTSLPPGQTVTVGLSDTVGLLSATGDGVTGAGSNSLTITGSLDAVNSALATLTDTDANLANDTIQMTASDSRGGVASPTSIGVDVNAPPLISVPGYQALANGVTTVIPGISIADSDAVSAAETLTVTLADTAGLLSATGPGVSGSGTTGLTISGSLSQVNTDLATLTDANSTTGEDVILINASDGRGGLAGEQAIVTTASGAPVISAPSTAIVGEGQPNPLPGIYVNEYAVVAGETFTVTLSDTTGLLAATGPDVGGTGTTSLTITGSLAEVNADLATLQVTEPASGSDALQVSATDSLGGAAPAVSVGLVAGGPPTIGGQGAVTIGQSVVSAITGVALSQQGAISSETFTVTLTDTNGILSATGTGVSGLGDNRPDAFGILGSGQFRPVHLDGSRGLAWGRTSSSLPPPTVSATPRRPPA